MLLARLLLLALLPAQEQAARIDAIVDAEIEKAHIPGALLCIAKAGKVIHSKGYGKADREKGTPVEPESVFRIGSITKQFTAAAILLLQEEEKLKLGDPLSKFLPDFQRGKEITIHHLLNHTSGIKSYTSLPRWREIWPEDKTPEEMIGLFRDLPLEFDPGKKWAYNNSAYFLLGVIVHKASGKPYGDYLKEKFFQPLGMTRTHVDRPGLTIEGHVVGYSRAGDDFRLASPLSMSQPGAAGAIVSTAEDLIRWETALHSGKVLDEDSYAAMLTPTKLKDGSPKPYGYGLSIRGQGEERVVGHAGGIHGFCSYMGRYEKTGVTVAILVNRDSYGVRKLASRIARAFER